MGDMAQKMLASNNATVFDGAKLKVTGDSLHQEIFASTEPYVSRQRKLL